MAVDPPAQQIETEPAAVVLLFRLRPQQRSAICFADILGLYEASPRCDPADCTHRQGGAVAFVDERPQERAGVFSVRVPISVKAAGPAVVSGSFTGVNISIAGYRRATISAYRVSRCGNSGSRRFV